MKTLQGKLKSSEASKRIFERRLQKNDFENLCAIVPDPFLSLCKSRVCTRQKQGLQVQGAGREKDRLRWVVGLINLQIKFNLSMVNSIYLW